MALTDLAAKAAKPQDKVYRLSDGGSLYLKVTPAGSKIWEFRFKLKGHLRTHVIGPYPETGIQAARVKRDAVRVNTRVTGVDPVTVKNVNRAKAEAEKQAARADAERIRAERLERAAKERAAKLAAAQAAAADKLTVESLVRLWTKHKEPDWSDRSRDQITAHLDAYVVPVIGAKSVASVTLDDVLRVIDALIADGKVETARRVRQRMSEMFDYALARDKVARNPVKAAAFDLKSRFRRAHQVHPEQSHPTVSVEEFPQLVRAMRTYVGTFTTRSLLWFIALTACRTGEARGMTWDEVDLGAGTVTLSAARMKARRGHTIYLSAPVIALLREVKQENGHRPFVFAHPRRDDRPCSENAVLFALAAIGYQGRMTGHGFRHLFSTLANESGLFRKDVIESALAHGDEDAIRATYNRAKYEDERRKLAAWWARTLDQYEGNTTNVIPMHKGG